MGMSTHVRGIKPPGEKWKKMKAIWDACKEANIEGPKEMREFFADAYPDDKGVLVELESLDCTSEFNDECSQGFEVDLTKLPPDVTIIRFHNSY